MDSPTIAHSSPPHLPAHLPTSAVLWWAEFKEADRIENHEIVSAPAGALVSAPVVVEGSEVKGAQPSQKELVDIIIS